MPHKNYTRVAGWCWLMFVLAALPLSAQTIHVTHRVSITDTLTITDPTSFTALLGVGTSSNVAISDTPSRLGTHFAALAEVVAPIDTLNGNKAGTTYARLTTDALGLADLPAEVATHVRTDSDTITLSPALASSAYHFNTGAPSDTATVGDSIGRFIAVYKPEAETLSLVDTLSASSMLGYTTYTVNKSDSATIGDVVVAVKIPGGTKKKIMVIG